MNIALGIMMSLNFEEKSEVDAGSDGIFSFDNFHNYWNRTLEILGLIMWTILIWRGTQPKLFYSKFNVITISIAGVLIVSAHIYGTYLAYAIENVL